jgi:hypothetical protein
VSDGWRLVFVVDTRLRFFTQYFDGTWECWPFLLVPLELSHKAPLRKYYRQLTSQISEGDAGYPFAVEDVRLSSQ